MTRRRDPARGVPAPVRPGDRLLVDTPITAVPGLTWTIVEVVEHHHDPGDLPWNRGPGFPFRIGYRIGEPAPGVGVSRGVLWLAADGTDPSAAVRAVDRPGGGAGSERHGARRPLG